MQGNETFKETKIFSEKNDVNTIYNQNNKNNLDKLLLKNLKFFVLKQKYKKKIADTDTIKSEKKRASN